MKKVKNKRLSLKVKAYICLGCVLFFLLTVFLYFNFIVGPLVVEVSRAQVDSVATTAVSDAIYDVIQEEGYTYQDFINVEYATDNTVSSITANAIELNNFARELSTLIQIYLDDVGEHDISVPLGTFTGITALSGIGPKIKINIVPIGSVITSFSSSFESAGINQTKHALYIDANISISVVLPLTTKRVDFVTQVLICENIIVGKVPEFYFSSGNSLFG